jgi:hypothetical protein
MNIPTHIMAKPVQVETDTGFETWWGAGIMPARKCYVGFATSLLTAFKIWPIVAAVTVADSFTPK